MSNSEKEINELAQDIAYICPDMVENYCGDINCVSCLAKQLASMRYRKEKAVAREILDEVSKHYGGKWLVDLYLKYRILVEE